MKIFVYDKFWDSFINLPKGIQKKVLDFQKKFREDSKSSAIHLEPINAVKDTTLRSARIDQAYRAIIKTTDSNEIYYLLWADHHDEAYQWAENKIFQWNDTTQSVQMFTSDETVGQISAEDKKEQPAEETKTFINNIENKKLLALGVPEVLLPSINKINTLEDLEKVENYIPVDVFENLFYLLEGANIDELISGVNKGKINDTNPDKQINSINNQRSFIELTDDKLFNEAFSDGLDKWKYYLHPSQKNLVTGNYDGPIKVSGGAGTGKTVVAMHRLKHLVEKLKSEEKILFTTYTNALTDNLTNLIKGIDVNMSNITLTNIDKLAIMLINKYNLIQHGFKVFEFENTKKSQEIWEDVVAGELSSFSPEFIEEEFKQIILFNNITFFDEYASASRKGRGKPISRRQRQEIWEYFEKFQEIKEGISYYYRDELFNSISTHLSANDLSPFSHCIIDEIQDFSNVELRMIRKLVKEKPNDLFLVGDPLQSIYNRKINFTKAGINIRGKRSQRLRINYRTTEEIKKLTLSVVKGCKYDNFDGEEEEKAGYLSLYHGAVPTYTVYKTKDEELNTAIESISKLVQGNNNQQGVTYADIAICARTNNSLRDFRNELHRKNIPYDTSGSDKLIENSTISLLTFHKTKGLEFKYIFIVDVNDRTFPKLPPGFNQYDEQAKEDYLKRERAMLYVAISRAIKGVNITGVGRKSELLGI